MKAKPDFHSATQSEWNVACEREAVIRPLAQADPLSPGQVDAGAALLGLSRSSVYRLVARFKRRPTTSSLLPAKAGQIDHAQLDVLVVDEDERHTLGRPWLTLAIDVASRAVSGFYV